MTIATRLTGCMWALRPRWPPSRESPVTGCWPARRGAFRPARRSVSYRGRLTGRGAMGKVLVLYDSASGNTAKMAGLVAEGAGGIPGTEVRLRRVEEATPDDVL